MTKYTLVLPIHINFFINFTLRKETHFLIDPITYWYPGDEKPDSLTKSSSITQQPNSVFLPSSMQQNRLPSIWLHSSPLQWIWVFLAEVMGNWQQSWEAVSPQARTGDLAFIFSPCPLQGGRASTFMHQSFCLHSWPFNVEEPFSRFPVLSSHQHTWWISPVS